MFELQRCKSPPSHDAVASRANLAIEVDGFAHDTGNRPERDMQRDAWLAERRIDTLRIPATDVLKDATETANAIITMVEDRLNRFGKATPSSVCDATSILRVVEEHVDEEE